jgi:hypothetical protein
MHQGWINVTGLRLRKETLLYIRLTTTVVVVLVVAVVVAFAAAFSCFIRRHGTTGYGATGAGGVGATSPKRLQPWETVTVFSATTVLFVRCLVIHAGGFDRRCCRFVYVQTRRDVQYLIVNCSFVCALYVNMRC